MCYGKQRISLHSWSVWPVSIRETLRFLLIYSRNKLTETAIWRKRFTEDNIQRQRTQIHKCWIWQFLTKIWLQTRYFIPPTLYNSTDLQNDGVCKKLWMKIQTVTWWWWLIERNLFQSTSKSPAELLNGRPMRKTLVSKQPPGDEHTRNCLQQNKDREMEPHDKLDKW